MSAAFELESADAEDADTAVSELADANAELGDVLDEASRLAESLDDESGRFSLDGEDEELGDERRQRYAGDESIAEELKALDDEPDVAVEDDDANKNYEIESGGRQEDAPDDEQDENERDADVDVVEAAADDVTELAPADASAEAEAADSDDDERDKLDLEGLLEPDDEGLVDEGESDRERSDDDLPELHDVGDRPRTQHDVPPMTEEEETINMLIDQDLLAIAQVDDDGFASTIVFEKDAAPVNVETVIIGEADDDEPSEAKESGDVVNPEHGRSGIFGLGTAKTEAGEATPNRSRSVGIAAAVVVLAIALAGQLVHQNREALATNPTFGNLLNPVYEKLGQPITPDWDVSGWDIARTQGATDEQDQLLTIFSEIRNTSSSALPYPIVTVSLTDRYQDPIGALILEPADYLASGESAGDMVPAGGKFDAVIPIDEPSPEAIGYTINACYRTPGADLRCAIADFK